MFSPYVVRDYPKQTIIGVDTLQKYPHLLYDCVEDMSSKYIHPDHVYNKKNDQARIALVNNYDIDMTDSLSQSLNVEILKKYSSIFSGELTQNNLCSIKKHEINTGTHIPICEQNARITIAYEKQIDEQISKLLNTGIIRPSHSAWRSRLTPVPKKNGELRLCIDYRKLNDITVKNAYPL